MFGGASPQGAVARLDGDLVATFVVAGGAGGGALLDLLRRHRCVQIPDALQPAEQLLHVVRCDAVRPGGNRAYGSLMREA